MSKVAANTKAKQPKKKETRFPESFTTPAALGLSLHNYARNFEVKNIQRFPMASDYHNFIYSPRVVDYKSAKAANVTGEKAYLPTKKSWTKSLIGVDDHIPFEKVQQDGIATRKGFLVFYLTFSLQAV